MDLSLIGFELVSRIRHTLMGDSCVTCVCVCQSDLVSVLVCHPLGGLVC